MCPAQMKLGVKTVLGKACTRNQMHLYGVKNENGNVTKITTTQCAYVSNSVPSSVYVYLHTIHDTNENEQISVASYRRLCMYVSTDN